MSRNSKNAKMHAKAKEVTTQHKAGKPAGKVTTVGKGRSAVKRASLSNGLVQTKAGTK